MKHCILFVFEINWAILKPECARKPEKKYYDYSKSELTKTALIVIKGEGNKTYTPLYFTVVPDTGSERCRIPEVSSIEILYYILYYTTILLYYIIF